MIRPLLLSLSASIGVLGCAMVHAHAPEERPEGMMMGHALERLYFATPKVVVATTETVNWPADDPGTNQLFGRWSSVACGERALERVIRFEPQGTFVSEDRELPCGETNDPSIRVRGEPPSSHFPESCVRSQRRGTFSVSGRIVTLHAEFDQHANAVSFPRTMLLNPTLFEVPDAQLRCEYVKE